MEYILHELALQPGPQQTLKTVLGEGTSQGKRHSRGPWGVSEGYRQEWGGRDMLVACHYKHLINQAPQTTPPRREGQI